MNSVKNNYKLSEKEVRTLIERKPFLKNKDIEGLLNKGEILIFNDYNDVIDWLYDDKDVIVEEFYRIIECYPETFTQGLTIKEELVHGNSSIVVLSPQKIVFILD